MSWPNLARTLLSRLEHQGIDPGEPQAATPGQPIDGKGGVLLILNGVAARQGADDPVALGLAGPGDLIGLDGGRKTGEPERGLWLTRGAGLILSAEHLDLIDRPTLTEVASADLRRRLDGALNEVRRHARLRVAQRLAALLLDIHRLGQATEVRLRQSDLADLLAVRRAGVSTACSELQAVCAIRVRRGAVVLSDITALRAAAERITPP
jgi:CRP-like cAMP-binding protein